MVKEYGICDFRNETKVIKDNLTPEDKARRDAIHRILKILFFKREILIA